MLSSQTQFQPTTVASTASTSSTTSKVGTKKAEESHLILRMILKSSEYKYRKFNGCGSGSVLQISEPILSVEASKILESALSPEVEQKMSEYLTP